MRRCRQYVSELLTIHLAWRASNTAARHSHSIEMLVVAATTNSPVLM